MTRDTKSQNEDVQGTVQIEIPRELVIVEDPLLRAFGFSAFGEEEYLHKCSRYLPPQEDFQFKYFHITSFPGHGDFSVATNLVHNDNEYRIRDKKDPLGYLGELAQRDSRAERLVDAFAFGAVRLATDDEVERFRSGADGTCYFYAGGLKATRSQFFYSMNKIYGVSPYRLTNKWNALPDLLVARNMRNIAVAMEGAESFYSQPRTGEEDE